MGAILALAGLALAGAAAVSGEPRLHERHYVEAKTLGGALTGQDRALFLATFDLIPRPDSV